MSDDHEEPLGDEVAEKVGDGDPAFRALIEKLNTEHAFDFRDYKQASLERRIRRRMTQVHVDSFERYMLYLDRNPDEHTQLLNVILINVTRFFRDPEAWESLGQQVLPRMLEDGGMPRTLRIWSAGCSSGEEPYTVAMMIAEHLRSDGTELDVKIYATDIDEDALATARHGLYHLEQLKDVPRPLFERYFAQEGQLYRIRRELRKWVMFGRHDLTQDAPLSHIDLLICRNVLIYFDSELQNRIMPRFQYAVRERGFLFLGRSEAMLARSRRFAPIDFKWRLFQRLTPPDLIGKPVHADSDMGRLTTPIARRDFVAATRLHSVVEAHPSAIVVIDLADTMLVWNPAAEALFDTAAEVAIGRKFRDLDISYRIDNLRSRVEEVKATEARVRVQDVGFSRRSGDAVHVAFTLAPLYDDHRRLAGVMLSAEDVTEVARLREELNRIAEQSATANEELQSTNEELETTNEELQSTNEELETTNEELQSTNEELETTVEELQAINTELGTLNTEIEKGSDEIHRVDLLHGTVLDAIDASVVVLDKDGIVRTWNLAASRIWGLKPQDAIGHPFGSLPIGEAGVKSAAAIHDALFDRKRTSVTDVRYTLPGGAQQQTTLNAAPLIAPNGDLLGAVLTTPSAYARP